MEKFAVTEKQSKYIDKKISAMTEEEIIKYTIDTHKASKNEKISDFRKFFDLKCFMFLVQKYKDNKDLLLSKIKDAAIPEYLKPYMQ
jgi:hypothetical protein